MSSDNFDELDTNPLSFVSREKKQKLHKKDDNFIDPLEILPEDTHLDKRKSQVVDEICSGCGNEIDFSDFKDSKAKKEYRKSKLCQSCQDELI